MRVWTGFSLTTRNSGRPPGPVRGPLSRWVASTSRRLGVVVAAAPQGGSKGQGKFLADCGELLQAGTEFMKLDSIALGVLTAKSQQLRLLQLADIVTSCTVARVGGESDYSPR